MSTVTASAPAHRSGWTITEGIVLVIAGLLAIGAPFATATVFAWALPFVLMVEGIILLVAAFGDRVVGSKGWSIALGILGIVAGLAVMGNTLLTLTALPTMLAIYLLIKGIMEFAAGASISEGKGWLFTAGAISVLFALLIWMQPFGASLLLTGLYIGISILVLGIMLLMLPSASEVTDEPVDTTGATTM